MHFCDIFISTELKNTYKVNRKRSDKAWKKKILNQILLKTLL